MGLRVSTIICAPTSGAPGKSLFVVPILGHTPEDYARQWNAELEQRKQFLVGQTPKHEVKTIARLEKAATEFQFRSEPNLQRYNDIVGFAELYWTGNGFLADFYFRADGRTKYGKNIHFRGRLNPKHYHMHHWQEHCGYVGSIRTLAEKCAALPKALHAVKDYAATKGCYVDLSLELQVVEHLDVGRLLGFKDSPEP